MQDFTFIVKTLKNYIFPNKATKSSLKKRMQFYSKLVKRGDLVFDVGANVGNRVEPLLELGSRIVAIEPQKKCSQVLKLKFGNKITVVSAGLGEADGIATFFISDSHTLSSFSADWISQMKQGRFRQNSWDTKENVDMTTLDHLIEEHGVPKFIKIDTEGYEAEVLKGLTKQIECISFEYTMPEQTEKAIECVDLIVRNGGDLACNYSPGESMSWAFEKWIPPSALLNKIRIGELAESGFGDIYVRLSHRPQ